jgi:hypothetical protein
MIPQPGAWSPHVRAGKGEGARVLMRGRLRAAPYRAPPANSAAAASVRRPGPESRGKFGASRVSEREESHR